MKTKNFFSACVCLAFCGCIQNSVHGQESPMDTIREQAVRVDTVWVEKVRVDTVWYEKVQVDPPQQQAQKPAASPQDPVPNNQKPNKKNEKVYFGGYANFSFGQYTLIGFEPLIAYKIFPKFSVGAKLSYEYVKDKRYETDYESSNYGVSLFARRRFFKRLYAHIEYSEMNYKLYDSLGGSNRSWVSFLYLGGGVSLPVSKSTSLNAEVLWDLIQDDDSPYKTMQPFFNVGIGVGF